MTSRHETRRQRALQAQVEGLRLQARQLDRQADALEALVLEADAPAPAPQPIAPAGDGDELTTSDLLALLRYRRRKTLYALIHDDPTFPKPRKQRGRNRWVRSEVDAWRSARSRAA